MRSKEFRKAMKSEAIKRMKILEIRADIINAYEDGDKLLCVKEGRVIDVPLDILNKIKAWEKEYGNLAYYVIFSELWDYRVYNALSVSCYIEDWKYERSLVDNGWAMAYTINVTKPEYSESGSIRLFNQSGLLQRIN